MLVQDTPTVSKYTLDQLPPVTFASPNVSAKLFGQQFYQSPVLPYGEHTLVFAATSSPGDCFFDYLAVTVDGPNSTANGISGNNPLIIDDTDPTIQYSGSWSPTTNIQEYNSTLRETVNEGAGMRYSFNGQLALRSTESTR